MNREEHKIHPPPPSTGGKIRVHLFFRRPVPGEHFSIERLFRTIASAMPTERYEMRTLTCPFESKGVIRRLSLVIWAALHQGDINHNTGDVNFLGLLMGRKRTLLTLHDSASMRRLSGWRRWTYWLFWLRLPFWHAACVTAVSQTSAEEAVSCLPVRPSRLAVVPNCVTAGIDYSRRPLSASKPRILFIGTKPHKNLEGAGSALQGLNCLLVVVGPLSRSQLQLLEATGVAVENHVSLDDSEIAEQYRDADLVLFVSTYEGFGLPILEAQTAGRPVITSDRSPMREVAGDRILTVLTFKTFGNYFSDIHHFNQFAICLGCIRKHDHAERTPDCDGLCPRPSLPPDI